MVAQDATQNDQPQERTDALYGKERAIGRQGSDLRVPGINQPEVKSLPAKNPVGREDLQEVQIRKMGAGATWSRGQAIHWREEMKETQFPESVVRFGAFEVNLQSRELRKYGTRMRLEEKPFQILELLLECAGGVVTRKTLRERLWPDTHVAYEHGLNTAVNKLRDLLGDSAQSPRYVETLPRRGYRFIAPVVKPGKCGEKESQSRAAIQGVKGSTFQPSTTSSGF